MASILNKIFIHGNKVLAHHLSRRSSVLREVIGNRRTFSSSISTEPFTHTEEKNISEYDLDFHERKPVQSVLEEAQQLPDVSHIAPELRPSFNFAYYANKSEVIQKLIDLGVDFHKIEQKKRLPTYLLKLDFEKDVKPYISFLFENGVPPDQMGRFFTKHPFICQDSLDDLQVRINYLLSKNFTPEMISRIITLNPTWLRKTTLEIDRILGDFQKELKLTGEEIRQLVHKRPYIIMIKNEELKASIFFFKDVIGYTLYQTKKIFLEHPYIWSLRPRQLQERFDYLLVDMKIPLSLIEAQPCCLLLRACKMRERHLFLKELGKAQYDPKKPNYVSLSAFSKGNDSTFCLEVAKTSIETYNLFLKTL